MNTSIPPNWRKNFYLFLIGQLLTGVTSMIVQYAIIWYLTLETGEESVLAIATLVGMLPMAILSPFVGPFIDRMNKKFLLIFYDAIVAVIALGLFIYGINNDVYPLWMVFVTIGIRRPLICLPSNPLCLQWSQKPKLLELTDSSVSFNP